MDRRRGARVSTQLWAKIAGVDDAWVLRRGNVSMTGVYVEIAATVGELASVQTLSISPYDRSLETTLLVRVARIVGVQDLWKGPSVAGVGLEFLPESPKKREQIAEVVHRVIAANAFTAQGLRIDARLDTQVEQDLLVAPTAVVRDLSITGMVLMTAWPVAVGESICCQIEAPESQHRVTVQGEVTSVAPDHDRFRVEVRFRGESQPNAPEATPSAEGTTISGAVGALLEEVLFPETDEQPPRMITHLRGSLTRSHLAGLLGFLELERMSGILKIRKSGSAAEVYLRQGQVIDARLDQGTDDPRTTMGTLLGWRAGEFEFDLQDLDRADRLGTLTSALLLDLAKDNPELSG
jgi:hypothetical protein